MINGKTGGRSRALNLRLRGNREAAPIAESFGGDLDSGCGLLALVLRPVDHADHAPNQFRIEVVFPRDLLRTSEQVYRELGLGKGEFSDEEIISMMVKHPDLIQRPIVERGSRAVLARPTENVKPLLS